MATNPNLQMTLGRLQLRDGKADLAVPILEKVAQQVPWAAEPLVLLYEAQTTLGRIEDAGATLLAAAQINPRYWSTLGQFYERQDKWEEAAAAYAEAVAATKQPSRDVQIRYAAALINTEDGAGKARTVLADLLKGTPNDTRVFVSAGDGGTNRRRSPGVRSDRAPHPRDRSDQHRPGSALSCRCCSSDTTTGSWPKWWRRS